MCPKIKLNQALWLSLLPAKMRKILQQEGPWAMGEHLRMTDQWSGTICEILVARRIAEIQSFKKNLPHCHKG